MAKAKPRKFRMPQRKKTNQDQLTEQRGVQFALAERVIINQWLLAALAALDVIAHTSAWIWR